MWIWYLSRSSHGKLGQIAKKAHAHGIDTVLIKSGDGTHYWSQFSPGVVSGAACPRPGRLRLAVHLRATSPARRRRSGAAAVANGADCLVLDVEGQYEGKYPQASYFMSQPALADRAGLSARARQLPLRRLPPGAARTRSSSARAAPSTTSRSSTGRTSARPSTRATSTPGCGTGSTGGQIDPLGQVYNHPKAGQIKRFRALAMSHGFDGVSWWSWQSAGKRQWKAVGQPDLARVGRAVPELSVPPSGLQGRLRRMGAAAARGWRVQRPDQRLLPGLDTGRGLRLPARPRAAPDRQPRRADLGPADAEQARSRSAG